MTAELGLALVALLTVVGVMVWLVILGQREGKSGERAKRQKSLSKGSQKIDKYHATGGLGGAVARRLSKPSDDE